MALPAVEPKAKATIQGKARQGVAEGQRCQEELRTGQERTSLLLEGADGWEEAPSAQAQLGKRKHRALWHPHTPAHSFLWLDDVLPSYFSWDFFALSNLFAKASHIVPRHLTRPWHTQVHLGPPLPPGPDLPFAAGTGAPGSAARATPPPLANQFGAPVGRSRCHGLLRAL